MDKWLPRLQPVHPFIGEMHAVTIFVYEARDFLEECIIFKVQPIRLRGLGRYRFGHFLRP